MDKKLTITIGIPAHNEEANIAALLQSLLNLNQYNLIISNIIIICDGCTDNTSTVVKKIDSTCIQCIDDGLRKGKAERLNEIIQLAKSDIVCFMDADILVDDIDFFSKIPFDHITTHGVYSVSPNYKRPTSLFEKILSAGYDVAKIIREDTTDKHNLLCFDGKCLFLSKEFATGLRIDSKMINMDSYIYLKAKSAGFKPKYIADAKIKFNLPNNIKDYLNQVNRFKMQQDEMETYFGNLSNEYKYTLPQYITLKALLKVFKKKPIYILTYLILYSYTRLGGYKKQKFTWETAKSTKRNLHGLEDKKSFHDLKTIDISKIIKGHKSATMFGNFGTNNAGDDLILLAQLYALNACEISYINIITRYSNYHLDEVMLSDLRFKINLISITSILKLIQSVITTDAIIIGGGGLFCKRFAGLRGILYQIYFITFLITLPKIFTKRIYIIGIGYYPNLPNIVNQYTKVLFRFVDYISVRDDVSYKTLRGYGFNPEYFKDNSYLLPDHYLRKDLIPVESRRINIGLSLKRPPEKLEETILLEFVLKIMQLHPNLTYNFYVLDFSPINDDESFAIKIILQYKELFNSNPKVNIIKHYGTLDKFGSFNKMSYFIAMRFHSQVICNRLNIPFYGISYDCKCTSFLESIGKTAFNVDKINYIDVSNEIAKAINA